MVFNFDMTILRSSLLLKPLCFIYSIYTVYTHIQTYKYIYRYINKYYPKYTKKCTENTYCQVANGKHIGSCIATNFSPTILLVKLHTPEMSLLCISLKGNFFTNHNTHSFCNNIFHAYWNKYREILPPTINML